MRATIHPDLLRAFIEVVDCGSFSKAAERLRRGQSAISLQIKRLETQLGVTLLVRSPRHIELTGDGELVLSDARRILALSDGLLARLHEPDLRGLVRLGAPEDFATTHLPGVLHDFAQAHPQVSLEVTCELTMDLLERFQRGELDLALIKREPSIKRGGIRVWREPLHWVAAHRDFLSRPGPLPLVVSPRPCVYRDRAVRALDQAGRDWRIAFTCASLSGHLTAVRAGLGLAVLPKAMTPKDLTILHHELAGLPALRETEIALIEAQNLSAPIKKLRDFIVHALEHGPKSDD